MKRLLGQIGITYLSVLAVVFYFGTTAAFVLSIAFLIALAVTLIVKKSRSTIYLPVMAAVALIACVANIVYTDCVYYKTIEYYDGYRGAVSATLKEEPYEYYGSYCYEFKADNIDNKSGDVKFALFYDELLDIEAYDKVSMEVALSDNIDTKLMSQGYFLTADFISDEPRYTVCESKLKPPYYWAIRLRQYMRKTLDDMLSDDAFALCSALLIGDKYALSNDIRWNFVKAGVSHLVVVSGLHFSIIVSLFFLLAKRKYRYRFPWLISAVVFIFVYMAVTGFSPSVMRSGIMLLIYAVGRMIGRDNYSLNSLGIAALAVTLFNPYSVGDVGLILSFSTTLSILKWSPMLKAKFCTRIIRCLPDIKLLKKVTRFVIDMVCVNIAAFVASVPLSILFFGSVATLSIVSSLVLYCPIWLLLILSLVLCLTSYIPLLAPLLCLVIECLSKLSLYIVSFFAELPFSYLYVTYDFVYLWLLFGLVLYGIMYLTRSKNRVKVLALSSALILLVGYLSAVIITDNTTVLNVYDVDNGRAVTYSSGETYAVLSLDCNKSNAVSTINKIGKTTADIDFYSSVADTTNSLNSLKTVSKEFAISSVLLYDTKRTISMPDTVCSVTTPSDVQTVDLGNGAVVTYCLVDDVYITYLDSAKGSVLILPQHIDAKDIPEDLRAADTIVMGNCPLNVELLSCDTLIISATADRAYNIMKFAHSICDRVLLTTEGDIRLVMEV